MVLRPPPLALPLPLPPALVSAPPFHPPLARSRTLLRLFFAVVVVAAAAALLPLALFPGLNSGNGTITPLGSTLPSPLLPFALRLQDALLHNRCCCCCCCCSISSTGVVLGVKSQGWLLTRSPPPVLPSLARLLSLLLLLLWLYTPSGISGTQFRGYAGVSPLASRFGK